MHGLQYNILSIYCVCMDTTICTRYYDTIVQVPKVSHTYIHRNHHIVQHTPIVSPHIVFSALEVAHHIISLCISDKQPEYVRWVRTG